MRKLVAIAVASAAAAGFIAAGCEKNQRRAPRSTANVSADLAAAEAAYDKADFAAAYRHYYRAIASRPDVDYRYHAHAALSASAVGKLAALRRLYRKVLSEDENVPQALYGRAYTFYLVPDRPDTENAGKDLFRASELDPASDAPLYLWALCYLTDARRAVTEAHRAKFLAAGEGRLRDVVRLNPKNADGWYYLAVATYSRKTGEPEASKIARVADLIGKAAPLYDPKDKASLLDAHLFLAGVYARAKRWNDALASLRRARAIDVAVAYERADLGQVLWEMGRRDEALREWNDALERLTPGSPAGFKVLASRVAHIGNGFAWIDFIPGGGPTQYQALASHVGPHEPCKPAAIAGAEILKRLNPILSPYFEATDDADGDGQIETFIVAARQTRPYANHFQLDDGELTIFRGSKVLANFRLEMDHVHAMELVDLGGDKTRDLLVAGFRAPATFEVLVFAPRDKTYRKVLDLAVKPAGPFDGVVVTDSNGDGVAEIIAAGGPDHWIDVYDGKTFAKVNARFPGFYKHYYERFSKADRPGLPEEVKKHLAEAGRILGKE